MYRLLIILSLTLGLVAPVAIGATNMMKGHSHTEMAVLAMHGEKMCVEEQCDEPSAMLCCDMVAGHCSTGLVAAMVSVWPAPHIGAIASEFPKDTRHLGLRLSFDPPPPRG